MLSPFFLQAIIWFQVTISNIIITFAHQYKYFYLIFFILIIFKQIYLILKGTTIEGQSGLVSNGNKRENTLSGVLELKPCERERERVPPTQVDLSINDSKRLE